MSVDISSVEVRLPPRRSKFGVFGLKPIDPALALAGGLMALALAVVARLPFDLALATFAGFGCTAVAVRALVTRAYEHRHHPFLSIIYYVGAFLLLFEVGEIVLMILGARSSL